MNVAIHKHKNGSTIAAIDIDSVVAVTVKGIIATYHFHSAKIEVECQDSQQAEEVIQGFITRDDE